MSFPQKYYSSHGRVEFSWILGYRVPVLHWSTDVPPSLCLIKTSDNPSYLAFKALSDLTCLSLSPKSTLDSWKITLLLAQRNTHTLPVSQACILSYLDFFSLELFPYMTASSPQSHIYNLSFQISLKLYFLFLVEATASFCFFVFCGFISSVTCHLSLALHLVF